MYFSCSSKGIDLEDASGQKPYDCVTRNSAQTQTFLSSPVNFTQVRASPAVSSLSEKTKDSSCLYTAPLIRKNILKLNSCHLQASPPVTHSDLRGAHEKEEAAWASRQEASGFTLHQDVTPRSTTTTKQPQASSKSFPFRGVFVTHQ